MYAIEMNDVWKRYRRGGRGASYGTLRDAIAHGLRGRKNTDSSSEFWALREIDLKVGVGEAVGIVGRNGAGKTTMLKVLSRITRPSRGSGVIRGRVGALLEVGTGFHLELTGRENIVLNGSILGMKRHEIFPKIDEVLAFAELEEFADTPVKWYSTGMHMRLAFSVASHFEPEIMLVDEVLAVGDAGFQRKCLTAMNEVGRAGRTVIFVSHNLGAIQRLCPRSILLDHGRILADGPTQSVLDEYHALIEQEERAEGGDAGAGGARWLRSWRLEGTADPHRLVSGDPARIVFTFDMPHELRNASIGMVIYADDGALVAAMSSYDLIEEYVDFREGINEVVFEAESLPLAAGEYRVCSSITTRVDGTLDTWNLVPELRVTRRRESLQVPPPWEGVVVPIATFRHLPPAAAGRAAKTANERLG
jgi:lipopolysaccharide transport system ATP-binding protein